MEDWPKHKKPCRKVAAALQKRLAQEEEAKIKAARAAVTNPLLPLMRQGFVRDVHELQGHSLLQHGLPGQALASAQDTRSPVSDLQGEPESGGAEEEDRGVKRGAGS